MAAQAEPITLPITTAQLLGGLAAEGRLAEAIVELQVGRTEVLVETAITN